MKHRQTFLKSIAVVLAVWAAGKVLFRQENQKPAKNSGMVSAEALDEAAARGWTVVSMKDDWKTIFPPANK